MTVPPRPRGTTTGRSRLCALLTTFERRAATLECLASLERSAGAAGVELAAVVVDDASRDGTAAAVAVRFAWARVVAGGGDLYWCRGMHRAFAEALADGHDHYLWLNDDTVLSPSAVATLLSTARERRGHDSESDDVIVVGSTADAGSGERTYGGELRPSRWRPLHVVPVAPAATAQRCDSMAGNIVLVPAAVAERLGNLDPAFEHAMGDTDYALRAGRAGVEIWLAPGVIGRCAGNDVAGTFRDRSLPLGVRWRLAQQRKGLPWRSWLRFARRHAGPLWPLHFAWPYLRLVGESLAAAPPKPRRRER